MKLAHEKGYHTHKSRWDQLGLTLQPQWNRLSIENQGHHETIDREITGQAFISLRTDQETDLENNLGTVAEMSQLKVADTNNGEIIIITILHLQVGPQPQYRLMMHGIEYRNYFHLTNHLNDGILEENLTSRTIDHLNLYKVKQTDPPIEHEKDLGNVLHETTA